jgi:hypothetical protein
MKLNIQPILKPLDLGEYDPEHMQGQSLQVWVNPPLNTLNELDELNREFTRRSTNLLYPDKGDKRDLAKRTADFDDWFSSVFLHQTNAWYARILSQGPEETRWKADDLDEVYQASPGLLKWIKESVMQLINEQGTAKKKS